MMNIPEQEWRQRVVGKQKAADLYATVILALVCLAGLLIWSA